MHSTYTWLMRLVATSSPPLPPSDPQLTALRLYPSVIGVRLARLLIRHPGENENPPHGARHPPSLTPVYPMPDQQR